MDPIFQLFLKYVCHFRTDKHLAKKLLNQKNIISVNSPLCWHSPYEGCPGWLHPLSE